eukprot:scaffold1237_cov182-Ochromonas_danica.AAC.2
MRQALSPVPLLDDIVGFQELEVVLNSSKRKREAIGFPIQSGMLDFLCELALSSTSSLLIVGDQDVDMALSPASVSLSLSSLPSLSPGFPD